MMLVDTSVWIDHLRHHDNTLRTLLEEGRVITHPFVIGELAIGGISPRRRKPFLQLLKDLPQADAASDEQVLHFIERHRLAGRGIGYVDVHLLAASHLTAVRLWTHDKRLRGLAEELRLAA